MRGVLFCLLAGVLVHQRVSAAGCDVAGTIGEVVPGTGCKQFKACFNGMVSSCPDGDIFVSSVGFCRPANQFQCDDVSAGPGSSGSNGKLCSKGQTYGPYPDTCAAFVECATNRVLRCLDRYLFDTVTNVCQPASQATCYEGSGDEIPDYVKLQCASLPLGSFVSHRDCSKYYICDGGVISVANCPAGKHFSRAYNGCVTILKAGCRALGTVCVGQAVGYQFPALDCSQYYTCPFSGTPSLQTCGNNQVFNPKVNGCVSSSSYQCEDIEIPGDGPGNPPTQGTSTSPPPAGNADARCKGKTSGTKISNPASCSAYYICNDGQAIPLVCYQGQYFSDQNQLCSVNNPKC